MIKAKKLITILASTLISMSVNAETISPKPEIDPTTVWVEQAISQFAEKNKIPGVAVELYVDGKLYEHYTGYANRETKDPVIKKTIFEIGSLSKVMTSVLLAQEVDWAKMALTDPVTKYVKDLPESFNKIKLQELATYTSGLPLNLPASVKTPEEIKQYFTSLTDDVEPGEQWIYSNVGVGLLGSALESSTERNFDDLYRRHILNPLGMVIGVTVPSSLTKYYAQGYSANGESAAHIDSGLFPAAGAVKASASDMQKFLSAAIGLPGTPPRVFYPMRLTQSVFVKMNGDYQGLGWQIHKLESRDISGLLNVSNARDLGPIDVQEIYTRPVYNGDALIDKTGATKGFRAYIAVIPNKKSGIVILVNKDVPNSAIVKTAREILFKAAKL